MDAMSKFNSKIPSIRGKKLALLETEPKILKNCQIYRSHPCPPNHRTAKLRKKTTKGTNGHKKIFCG